MAVLRAFFLFLLLYMLYMLAFFSLLLTSFQLLWESEKKSSLDLFAIESQSFDFGLTKRVEAAIRWSPSLMTLNMLPWSGKRTDNYYLENIRMNSQFHAISIVFFFSSFFLLSFFIIIVCVFMTLSDFLFRNIYFSENKILFSKGRILEYPREKYIYIEAYTAHVHFVSTSSSFIKSEE